MSPIRNFKTRAIKFIAALLLASLITCAATFVWGYYNRPILFDENTGSAAYNVDPSSKHNTLYLKLNRLEGNYISGEALLVFWDKEEAERVGKVKNRWLEFPYLGAPFSSSQDFFLSPDVNDTSNLKPAEGVKLFSRGNPAAYPFDDYVLGFSADVRYGDGTLVNDMARVKNFGVLVTVDLPNTLRVAKEKDTAKVATPFLVDFQKPRPLREDEFLFYIDRPLWLKAFVVGALLFLLIPLLLILRTPINNWALDLIAALVSVATVRGAIFGASPVIHWIDIWLGAVVLLMGAVPLVKVMKAKSE